ncbi:MAG: MATE family efflux transporter [Haloarcula sp.]
MDDRVVYPNPVKAVIDGIGTALARVGLIDESRARETSDLAWPRIVTGLARMSQSAADLAMVGTAVGAAAIAGLGFASPFWLLGVTLALGLSGGTISQVSQRYGTGDDAEISVVIKQSVLVELLFAVPFVVAFATVLRELIGLLTADPAAIGHGATYLRVMALAVAFEFANKVASRTLVGVDDAWTPMVVRSGGAVVNIGLNAVFIFGFGLGVFGAALGTVVATVFVTLTFAWGFLGGSPPVVGQFDVTVDVRSSVWDLDLGRQLLRIAGPLILTRQAQTLARFPLLAIVALFGPGVVAAFVTGRRVRGLLGAPGWGFGLASSSLVGRHLGTGDEAEAGAYASDILWYSMASYALLAVGAFVFGRQVARVFVSDPDLVNSVTTFVRVAAVSVLGAGVNRSTVGPLRASGDTRWPLYGKLVGLYVFTIPIAYAGIATPLGINALYLSLVAETTVPAAVTYYRYRSGRWKVVSRTYRPDTSE